MFVTLNTQSFCYKCAVIENSQLTTISKFCEAIILDRIIHKVYFNIHADIVSFHRTIKEHKFMFTDKFN